MSFADITDIRDGLYPSMRQTLAILRDTLPKKHLLRSSDALRVVADKLETDIDEIYDAIIDTARWNYGLPLVDGMGNFWFFPAYHRYTEINLMYYFEAITGSKQVSNYGCPFPMAVPYALAAGTIGYSMSITKIPTHNLGETIDASIALIKNPEMETLDLLRIIKGPDLAIGGIVENPKELPKIYETGSGMITMILDQENIGEEYGYRSYYELAKDYAGWYDIKARKLRSKEAVRIEIPYHAYVTDGTETRLMSLKEILCGYIDHLRSCKGNISDEEMCESLLRFKKLSFKRQTYVEL